MSAAAFYADCDSDTQQWAVGHIRPMPGKPFGDPATEGSWHRIPSTYIVCAEDAALPPEVQRNVFAPRTAETVEMQVSHSPFLSQPQALADLLAARVR